MINNMIKKAGSKGLLVLKTDCLGLQASVVTGNRNELTIKHSVHSREIEPLAALKDILTQLKMYLGKSIPTDTLLLHINTIPNQVAINQNADAAGGSNLAEMMRWEMDGIVADQSPMWDLAWVLLQRGYITSPQYVTLLELTQEEKRAAAQTGGNSAQRIGDIAIREKMASPDEVAECLLIQEKLQLPDQRLLTQWRPLPTPESGQQFDLADNAEQAYLCSAMPIAQHLQWVNAFNKITAIQGMPKLALKQVYPLAGNTITLLDSRDRMLLTEFHAGYAFCALIEQGIIRDSLMFKSSSQPLDIVAMADVLKTNRFDDVDSWVIANIDGVEASEINLLESLFELRADFMPRAADIKLTLPSSVKKSLLAELGAAAHFYGRSPLLISPLSGMPPPEAFYKRKQFRVAAAIALAPMILLGYEGFRYLQINKKEQVLQQAERELARYGDDNSDVEAEIREATDNIQKYKALEIELNGLQYRKDLVQSVLLKRQSVVEKLLPTLSHSINDGIILDSMNETNWYQFTLTGRAVDQNSIDEFNRVLSINLQPLNMRIIDSPSRLQQKDAYSYGGVYVFEFTLIKRPDA